MRKGRRISTLIAVLTAAAAVAMPGCRPSPVSGSAPRLTSEGRVAVPVDTVQPSDSLSRYDKLSDADFCKVAAELQVEVAVIKAVVEIEAGRQMKGFWAPGVPVVNFSRTLFAKYRKNGKGKGDPTAKVPAGLSGYALKEWTQIVNARRQNSYAANVGAYWGMFQIGGFNYKTCGCESIDEFVRLMSYSELEQLELFATFITNSGMLGDLRSKNWAAFARKYNGPNYAKRGYHTKMAAAYAKYKR